MFTRKKPFPLSTILRERRELSNLSVDDVISKLEKYNVNISAKTLYGYESGVSVPKVNTFLYLCDIYGVSDIMGTFGYSSIAAKEDWPIDLYNDFFNTDLLGKVYILVKNGIPSFSGYEEKLESLFFDDSTDANFHKLYAIFSTLNELGQGVAIGRIMELSENPDFLQSDSKQNNAVG